MTASRASASPSSQRQRLLEALLIVATALLFAYAMAWPLSYAERTGSRPEGVQEVDDLSVPPAWLLPLDDAYIFIRYAQQLGRGHPFEWSPGEASTGSSSFLFPLLLLPGQWLADSIDGWSLWSRWVGAVGLAFLGLAAASWLRRVPLPEPWPLAGALSLVLSGPIGLVALAGMEGAWNAAALVATCAFWPGLAGEPSLRSARGWLMLVALLPLIRPENAFVSGLLAVWILAGRVRLLPRWSSVLALVPGLGLALLNWCLTGIPEPTGAVAKSWTATPFLDLPGLLRFWGAGVSDTLIPVYAGLEPAVLYPPIGLAAVATSVIALIGWLGARTLRLPRLLAASAAMWGCLVLVGPLSSHLKWQWMRHHHSGLALAWLLGLAGIGLAIERWAPRLRRLSLLVPLLLLLALPKWISEYTRLAWGLSTRHGAAARWLEQRPEKQVLLLNDAGWLSLAHDGPAIDAIGLGTPMLAHADRNGAGSLAETLARHPLRPRLVAVNLDNFSLPQLLGERLLPERDNVTVLAKARSELLEGTILQGPGLDFGVLADEERWQARWEPSLLWANPRSVALALSDGSEVAVLQGCRPVIGALSISMSNRPVLVAATSLENPGSRLSIRGGSRDQPLSPPLVSAPLPLGRWAVIEVPALDGEALWLQAEPGPVPCVESISLPSVFP